MATITWTGSAGDNNFDNPANWNPQQVPGASDDVTIAPPAAVTIAISQNDAVQSLKTSKLVTLSVSTGESLTVGNAGTANASLNNAGVIQLNSSYYNSALVIGGPKVTLSGGGTIAMGDFSGNVIVGAAAGDILNNTNNLIEGAGSLGGGALTFVNGAAGVVNANLATQLFLNTGGSTVANSGLLEATAGGGGLVIQSNVNNGASGRIAAAGGVVYLANGAIIAGGTLSSSGGAAIELSNTATFDGTAKTLSNTGTTIVETNTTLTLLGTIVNSGTIDLTSSYYNSALVIGPTGATAGTVTLTGGGTVVLGDYAANVIYGAMAGDTLVNLNNTISGAGQLGYGSLNLVNDGIIVANAAGNALVINTGTTAINNALIESTGGAGLIIDSSIDDTGGGTLLAAGGVISLNAGTISGGIINVTGGGAFTVTGAGTLDGSVQAVTNLGTIGLNTNTTLTLLGTFMNDGVVTLNSSYYDTDFVVGSPTLTLTGGGTITMGDYAANRIYGAAGSDVLDNLNNTIQGGGQLGVGQLTLINRASGIIDANAATNALILNTGSTVSNAGLIEATGAAGLLLEATISNIGTVLAANSTISINGATIAGGLVSSTGTGAIVVTSTGTIDGSGHAVTLNGTLDVSTGTTLSLLGSLINAGTINLESSYYNSDLVVSSPTLTLTGGGTITMGDYAANRIYGAVGTDVLDNVNNVIQGGGQVGAGQLTLINEKSGVIDANAVNNALTLTSGGAAIVNAGLIESTGGAGLVISTAIDSSSGGTILAANGTIYLSGADLEGGLAKSTGTGAFVISNTSTFDGSAHALTLAGSFGLNTGTTLTVLGSLVNQGTLSLNSNYYNSDLIVGSSTVTLTGGGTIALGDYPANRIYGAVAANVLDNVNNTISGAGQLGAGQLTLINAGTINATGGNALIVNLGSTGTNTASGKMLATGTGGLVFQNGTYSNSGLIQANDGSAVTFQSGATLTNDSATGTLTGGTYAAVAKGNGATLTFTGAAVNTLAADLIFNGAGSAISFGGTAVQDSLGSIGKSGELQILGSAAYTTKMKLSNAGTVVLGGGTLKAKSLGDKSSTSLLSGYGTLAASLTSAGTINAMGGALLLDGKTNSISGAMTGTGKLDFDSGATTFTAGASLGVSTAGLINGATLNLATSISFAGEFDIAGGGRTGSAITGTGTFTSAGLFNDTAKLAATVGAAFSNTGTIAVAAASGLAFSGGLANSGLILAGGTFTDTAALTGGSLNLTGTGAAVTIASGTGAANSTLSTLTVAGGTLNTSGTTLTVTGDYNNQQTGTGNGYMPFAGVTGTINGQGTQLAVVGVNGTHIRTVHGVLTITVAPGGTASFEIENTGAAGSAALRGALETTVNGGTINGTALSGSGVTAQNYGPIAAGGASGIFTISYSGGTLNAEAIHIASDFANVAGLTIDIVAGTAHASVPAGASLGAFAPLRDEPAMAWMHHVGLGV